MRVNLCSGQRPFVGWTNIDTQAKWSPDIVADGANLPMIADESVEMVVIHHGLEHFGLGEADSMFKECYRILEKGGSLIICVPDLRALAKAWLRGEINSYIYCVNLYGAYMNDEADRHKWGFDSNSLTAQLWKIAKWRVVLPFDHRPIEGADIAQDFWILSVECVK